MYNRLAVFDFDGTIATVPEKPRTPEEKKEYGWNGKDWWGSEASFSKDVYPHDEVIEAFREARECEDTHAIVLTGRRGVIAHAVRKWLRERDLIGRRMIAETHDKAKKKFLQLIEAGKDIETGEDALHDEYFKDDYDTEPDYPALRKDRKTGRIDFTGGTLDFKRYIIKRLCHNGLTTLEMWEDRSDHVPHFIKFGLELKKQFEIDKVILHRIFEPPQTGLQPHVQHIPLKEGMVW